jgi:hypothetical protein
LRQRPEAWPLYAMLSATQVDLWKGVLDLFYGPFCRHSPSRDQIGPKVLKHSSLINATAYWSLGLQYFELFGGVRFREIFPYSEVFVSVQQAVLVVRFTKSKHKNISGRHVSISEHSF